MKLVLLVVILPKHLFIRFRRSTQGDGQGVVDLSQELSLEFSSIVGVGPESKTVFSEFGSEN